MIRVTVSYPNEGHVEFDHQYYRTNHRRIVEDLLTPYGLLRVEMDQGLADGNGGKPFSVAAAHLIFETLEGFQKGMAAVGADILSDIPNYTNAEPRLLIARMID